MSLKMSSFEFACPHCGGGIIVSPQDVACGIMRHAAFKTNGEPVPPHAPREACEELLSKGLVWGCCGPLRYSGGGVAEACGYV